jgi:hypothetical protein
VTVHDEIEGRVAEGQPPARVPDRLLGVVGSTFVLHDRDAERPEPSGGDGCVRRPALAGDRASSVAPVAQPLAATRAHVEHRRRSGDLVVDHPLERPRRWVDDEAVTQDREIPPVEGDGGHLVEELLSRRRRHRRDLGGRPFGSVDAVPPRRLT